MRTFSLSVLFFMLFTFSAAAQYTYTTVENRVACIYKSDLEKVLDYAAVKDRVAFDKIVDGKRCLVLKGGVEVQLMDSSWSRVEIRPMGLEGTLWTQASSIKPKK